MKHIVVLLIFCSSGFISLGQHKVESGISTLDTTFFNSIKHFQVLPANKILSHKIRILRLDNMPCLLTDVKLIAAIPNAVTKNEVIDNMPNPLKKD